MKFFTSLVLCLFFQLCLAQNETSSTTASKETTTEQLQEEEVYESDSGNATGKTTVKPTESPTSQSPTSETTTSSPDSTGSTTGSSTTTSSEDYVEVTNTVIKGSMTMDLAGVEDLASFISDPDVVSGVEAGIASSLNVPASYVKAVLSLASDSDSYRRLQASTVTVDYTTTIPGDDPNAANFASAEEINSQMTALATGSAASGGLTLESLAAAIVSKIQEAKPNMTVQVTVSGVSEPTQEVVVVTVTTTSSSTTSSTSTSEPETPESSAKTSMAFASVHLAAFLALLSVA